MRHSSRDKPLFYSLLALLFWLPLPLGSNRAWAWALMEVGIQLLAAAWLVMFFFGRVRLTIAFKRATPVLILFLLWLLFLALQLVPMPLTWLDALSPQAADIHRQVLGTQAPKLADFTLSLDAWASGSFLLKSWSYFLLFCLVLLLIRNLGRIKTAVTVLVLGGVVQALFGSFMTLSGVEYLLFEPKTAYIGTATGTFVNRNHLAGYLNMSLALGIGWLVAGARETVTTHWKQKLRNLAEFFLSAKMRLRVYLVIMTIALVLTHSRMGNTAFFASLLVAGLLWMIIRRQRPKSGAIIILVSILLIDVFILGQWFGLERVVERLQETSMQREKRDDVVRDSKPYAEDFWLTGSGAGTFYSVFPRYMDSTHYSFYDFAHNDYLQFFVEVGVVGSGILAVIVLFSLYCAIRAMVQRRHPYLRALGYGSFMGVLAILIHSSVDFNLQIPANAAMFVTLLALAWVAYGSSSSGQAGTREL